MCSTQKVPQHRGQSLGCSAVPADLNLSVDSSSATHPEAEPGGVLVSQKSPVRWTPGQILSLSAPLEL